MPQLKIGLVQQPQKIAPDGSVAALFGTLERLIGTRHRLVRLPSFVSSLSEAAQLATWREFFAECDMFICSFDMALQMREKLNVKIPAIYMSLGDLPRGAQGVLSSAEYFRSNDTILFTSTADQEIFRRVVRNDGVREVLLPLMVDVRHFAPSRSRQAIRSRLGVDDGDALFLYVGRVTSEKNVHQLLTLMSRVLERFEHARLLVVGPVADVAFREFGLGPYDLEEIFAWLRSTRPVLADRLTLLPSVDRRDLPAIYSAADVFVNATLHHDENFGFANVEAMSCGLPVVATDWGGLKDTIVDGVTGFKVGTRVTSWGVRLDLWRMYRACAQLAASATLRKKMGRAARARTVDHYSEAVFESRLSALLAEVRANVRQRPVKTRNLVRPTRLGRRLIEVFVENRRADRYQVRFHRSSYDCYEQLISPYASKSSFRSPSRNTMLFVCAIACAVSGRSVQVQDPLWPGRYEVSAVASNVVRVLLAEENTFLPYDELRRRMAPLKESALRKAVERLVRMGIVGVSSE